jgi:hypothetical protein
VVEAAIPGTRGALPDQVLVRAELLRVDFPPGPVPPVDPGVFARRGTEVTAAEGPFEGGRRIGLLDASLATFDPLAGRLVRYAVRWRDVRGRPSALTLAPDLVLAAPPAAPGGVVAEPVPEGVRLRWLPPQGGAPAGYNVYRAAGEGPLEDAPRNAEPLKETSFVDAEVVLGTTYRYLVRALAADGPPPRESAGSPPVTVLALDRFAPEAPRDLVAVREGASVRVFWTPGGEPDLAGYRIERRVADGPWERIAEGVTQAQWLDPEPAPGALAYRVFALDRADPQNVSPPSEPVEVAAPLPAAPPEPPPPEPSA